MKTTRALRVAAPAFRWSYPRWVIAQSLEQQTDGLESRELLRRTRGQGAHPRAAIEALAAIGYVRLTNRSPRCFLAEITEAGREALRIERIRRGGRPPTQGPILPPRDDHGRLIFTYAFESVPTHPPGDLWRRVMGLVMHLRSQPAGPALPAGAHAS